MCRAACRTAAGESGTNLAMVNIIKSQFGKEYDARGKEVKEIANYARQREAVCVCMCVCVFFQTARGFIVL